MSNTRAKWIEGIPDLYDKEHLGTASGYLTVAQVSEATGLSPNTITDLLSRAPITSTRNTVASISRPDARIGSNPLYSQRQVDEVLRRQLTNRHRHLGGGDEPLKTLTPEEARRRGLISVAEIAAMASAGEARGMHEQTVRRWARERKDFPPAVALRARDGGHPGVPIVVRSEKKARAWLIRNGYLETEPAHAAS